MKEKVALRFKMVKFASFRGKEKIMVPSVSGPGFSVLYGKFSGGKVVPRVEEFVEIFGEEIFNDISQGKEVVKEFNVEEIKDEWIRWFLSS